ncbi:MAG: hypothetical protein IT220_09230 [Flavobacteriaceae bacterium]|nr:hypothetical protein [Flavobacteriaceae bacterium]
MFKFQQIVYSFFFVFVSSNLIAQINNEKTDCNRIIINDSLTVNDGDYVLDKKIKIELNKTFLDSTNIKSIYVIKNPCSNFHSGYRGAYVIERKLENPLVELNELVKNYKAKYPDFSNYQIVINKIVIENYENYLIEVTNRFVINIIQDELRERKLTIFIEQ